MIVTLEESLGGKNWQFESVKKNSTPRVIRTLLKVGWSVC